MRRSYGIPLMVGVVLAVVLGTLSSFSQDETGRQGGRRGVRDGQGMGQFDPSQMRAMMLGRIKQELNATDDEWKVIEPLVENVAEKQREARGGFGMGRAMRRPGSEAGGPGADMSQEVEALRTALDSEESSSEDIKSKVEAVRADRKKKESELKSAREELRKVLTLRQEARLVLMGLLD